jgi:hypothetical protein
VDALPKGYQAASTFTGAQADEIPVFVFSTEHYPEFFKFYSILKGSPPRFWWRMLSRDGAITISQSDSRGHLLTANAVSMGRSMSHEMTHQLIGRVVGQIKDLPNWFNEGAAQSGEAVFAPTMHAQNDRRMQRLLAQNAILPLDQLISSTAFHDSVDQLKEGQGKGDAYAQGFSMTRFLGFLLKGEKMSDFLTSIQQKQSFEAAVKDGTGLTMEEFYQAWLKAITEAGAR